MKDESSSKRSEAGKKGMESRWNNNNVKNLDNNVNESDNNVNESDNKKVKKEIKSIQEKEETVHPTLEEVENYFAENGYTKESGKKAYNYYALYDWKDSRGNPVINWKQKMQVWFKPENELQQQDSGKIYKGVF